VVRAIVGILGATAATVVATAVPKPAAIPLAHAASATPIPQLGLVHGPLGSSLVRIDPQTLRARSGRRLDVGSYTFGWSFSPDGTRLALAGDLDSLAIPAVLVVDTQRLLPLGRIRLARSGWVRATTWLPSGRLVAVVSVFMSGGVRTDVVTVDPSGPTVMKRQALSGQVLRVARSRDRLVVLLASADSLGPARLAIVGPSGATRRVAVDRIRAGSERAHGGGGAEFSSSEPGLAVDPGGRSAFVVAAGGTVGEVDLLTHAIAYHHVGRRLSSFDRRPALAPLAAAKSIEGPTRVARWLSGGLIAVSGGDYAVEGTGARAHLRFTTAGLELIDTHTWTARTLGGGTDAFWPAGDLLVAATTTWSSELELPRPAGLVVYGADRRERFRLYEGKRVWVIHADARRAYVRIDRRADVVDLASGRVVERRKSAPYPLAWPGAASES
jgi:hypothetical protein